MPAEKRKINSAFSISSTRGRSHSSLVSISLLHPPFLALRYMCVRVCCVDRWVSQRLLGVKDSVCSASVWSSGHMAHKHTAPQARPGPPRDTYTTKSLSIIQKPPLLSGTTNTYCTETHTSLRPSAAVWFSGTGSFPSSWWKEKI